MKVAMLIVGVLLILTGGIWFLQGVNILPGSVMTGQLLWAIFGGIAVVLGVILLVLGLRRGTPVAKG
jgi:hypothetical protein